MRIMHLSDLHIGLKWLNRSMIDDQIYILNQITEIIKEHKPDAVVIAGDIYDKAIPSAEAVKVFDNFISGLSAEVPDTEIMVISGNHDSSQRIDIFRNILAGHKIHMIGNPPVRPEDHIEKVTLHDSYGNVNFYLLPFIKPSVVRLITGMDKNGNQFSYNSAVHMIIERENINTEERNVIVSHQFYLPCGAFPDNLERMDSERITVGNIDVVYADVLEKFDYSALGHIHKPSQVGNEFIRYCGTPLACSVSEAGQQKGIIMAELNEKGNVKTSVIPLEPLHRVRVIKGTPAEVIEQGCEDYVSIILTEKPDKTDIGRISEKFPNLLEIRRKETRKPNKKVSYSADNTMSPFELCTFFLKDTDEEEQRILRDVINKIQEESEI
ncbi:MAG: exonuclease SbcCD subunit D [Ruminococcus flavefaciens]|nr:exonuclease SbcCD subunit D [Ruminococcus flavefaciens]